MILFSCADLTWMLSLKDYWYAFVSAVLGAAFGIYWTIQQFKRAEAKAAMRCIHRIRGSLAFNIDRLNQARTQFANSIFPNYPFDTSQLNHWLTQSYDALGEQLFQELDWQRYQLDHITSKLNVANTLIVITATGNRTPAQQQYIDAVRNDLMSCVDGVLNALPPLIQRLEQVEARHRDSATPSPH